MTMTSEPTPEDDLIRLAQRIQEQGVSGEAWERMMRDAACERLVNLMGERLSRITIPITSHYDWDRLRTNVAHKVEPKLVKWSK
jgi:hypothetical protein